jgi:hypothetical protein
MSDTNTDPAVMWRWVRCKKRGQDRRKHHVHPFIHDNSNPGAYIASKELNQDLKVFNHFIY